MKKILSLCLAVVMLLGLVAMAVSAEGAPAYDGYTVSLGEDISLNVYFKDLDPAVTYTAKVNGEDAKLTVDGTDGVVKISALTPAMIANEFTVALYNGEDKVAETDAAKSVLGYCNWALTNMDLSNDVHTLVVNLLNYAEASQNYLVATGKLADADAHYSSLTDLEKALAISGVTAVNPYLDVEDQEYMTFKWSGASLVLGESVAYRFYFTTAVDPENFSMYRFEVTMDGVTTVIQAVDAVAKDDGYYIDFTALTPADLRKDVTVVGMNINDVNTSRAKTFSAERYASYYAEDANVNPIMSAILNYSKAAEEYNAVSLSNPTHTVVYHYTDTSNLRPISTGTLTAHEIYRFSMLEGFWPSSNNVPGSLVNTYAKVGVDISGYSTGWKRSNGSDGQSIHWAYNSGVALFVKNGVVPNTYTNLDKIYVPGSANNPELTVADLQIGDAFLGKNKANGGQYWTIILLSRDENGVGRFLAINSSKRSYILKLNANQTLEGLYLEEDAANTTINKFYGEETFSYNEANDNWDYTYVFRPNGLAN